MTRPIKREPIDQPERLGLPPTPFLFHLDQVATMLGKTLDDLCETNIYFLGRSMGKLSIRQIKAVNIAVDETAPPEWRVTEGELIRWLKVIGIKVHSRGRVV